MFSPRVLDIDRALAGLARRVDVLLDVTPVNTAEAWTASIATDHTAELDLRYRPARTDAADVRSALATLPIDDVEDASMRHLFADKRAELDAQARLVAARGTAGFLEISLGLYGTADDRLVALAEGLLDRLPPPDPPGGLVGAADFVRRAEVEIERYRTQRPDLRASVQVRDDVPSLMVVQRDLLVGTDSWIPEHRQEALIHHEVGVHLLTAETGGRQPLELLEQGLAGYEETQEALGVLAEYLVGGLDTERLRTLAARAVAARALSDGAGFGDLYSVLHGRHGIETRAAWTIAMRMVRGGGFTKDVIYLRGLVELVDHLATGGRLEPLLMGRAHLRDLGDLERLLAAGALEPPALRPHWLDGDGPRTRLAAIGRGDAPVARWP
ncbi:hypothetical protein BH23ACT2_BH23ACT2_05980 [soil metagenome]